MDAQPVVIDNGGATLKAGFAGEDKPKVHLQNLVGRVKHRRVMAGGALEGDTWVGSNCSAGTLTVSTATLFVGKKLTEHRGALFLSHPMSHGVVEDWDDMQRVWNHVFEAANLGASPKDHPLLITELPLNPAPNRARAAELLFEALDVPALCFGSTPTLALYASGRTTGLVLDVGDGAAHAVPVYEGFALAAGVTRLDFGGRDVTRFLASLLRRAGAVTLSSSAELEVARELKESACYVAKDPTAEEAAVAAGTFAGKQEYRLPDGQRVQLGAERFRAPDALFRPAAMGVEGPGVAEALAAAALGADMGLRRALLGNVVLAGGSTLFRGFGERLVEGARRALPPGVASGCKVKVWAPAERRSLAWVGGSILASLGTFRAMCVTRAQWAEQGERAVHRAAAL